ncbi:hypothetical protein D3C80_965910 [compost metagenome]
MTTPAELITLALKQSGVIGVGQTASAEDMNDAFKLLQMMLGQWQVDRFAVFHLITTSKVCTGAQSYTIGPGGDFNIPRPDRISSAFIRQLTQDQPNQADYPLTIIDAREDYNRITLKEQGTWPVYLFYDSGFPMGTLYPWSIPDSQFELFVTTYAQIQNFANLQDSFDLPSQYEEAIMWNLAGRLRPMYGMQPDVTISQLAMASLNTVKGSNTQIPRMQIDPVLTRRGTYNPYSDQVN